MDRFEHNYDIILYGASVAGVAAALYLTKLDKKVLLVNHFGFPGGAITESLCCLQTVEPENLPEMTSLIFKAASAHHKAGFAVGNGRYYFDPESLKYTLLQLVLNTKCTPLFHVKARAITGTNEPGNNLHLLAKEGTVIVAAPLILDTTDEQTLAQYVRKDSKPVTAVHFNMVVTGQLPEHFQWQVTPQETILIGEERRWVSFLLPNEPGAYPDETAQEFLQSVTSNLFAVGCSVQVLPVQPFYYSSSEIAVQRPVAGMLSDSVIGAVISLPCNVFARAAAIENNLRQIFEQ